PYEIEYRLRARDGSYRWFLGRALPEHDGAGGIVRWLGTCTDIDDRKRAEEALREAARCKDEFLAIMAHELRNPLAPMRNALQIMKLPEAGPTHLEQARAMLERQLQHLVRLVDDLLDTSRVGRGTNTVRKGRVELAPLVARAVEAVRNTVEAQHHQL